jgi:hypothetical protein
MMTLYQVAKTLHIIGFAAALGITFTMYLAYSQFWKLYASNAAHALAAFRTFKSLQVVGMISLLLVIIAGVTMLAIMDWTFVQQLWFQIKLGLIGLILVNGFTLGRTSTIKLHAFIDEGNTSSDPAKAKALKKQLNTFQLLQIIIYVCIIALSVFRIS